MATDGKPICTTRGVEVLRLKGIVLDVDIALRLELLKLLFFGAGFRRKRDVEDKGDQPDSVE